MAPAIQAGKRIVVAAQGNLIAPRLRTGQHPDD
jgi:hypothetical protein